MPHDPQLAARMRRALASRKGVTEKRMFGGFRWMLRGNMLCGVEGGRFMFRVGKEFETDALGRPGASPMDGPRVPASPSATTTSRPSFCLALWIRGPTPPIRISSGSEPIRTHQSR